MTKYQISYGMGGGFGGLGDWEDCDAITLTMAEEDAYQMALDNYDSYDGSYGLQTVQDIMAENSDYDEETAQEAWEYERESWIVYAARETPSD